MKDLGSSETATAKYMQPSNFGASAQRRESRLTRALVSPPSFSAVDLATGISSQIAGPDLKRKRVPVHKMALLEREAGVGTGIERLSSSDDESHEHYPAKATSRRRMHFEDCSLGNRPPPGPEPEAPFDESFRLTNPLAGPVIFRRTANRKPVAVDSGTIWCCSLQT